MPSTTPISPPPVRASDAPRSAPPPPGAGPGDFAALLNQTTARTAPAEGQQTRPSRPEAARRDDGAEHGRGRGRAKGVDDAGAEGRVTPSSPSTPASETSKPDAAEATPTDAHATPGAEAPSDAPATPGAATAPVGPAVLAAALVAPIVPPAPGPATPAAGAPAAGGAPQAPVDALPQAAGDAAAAVAPGAGSPGGLVIPAELLKGGGGTAPDAQAQHGHEDDGKPAPDLPPPPAAADPSATPAPATAPAPAAAPAAPVDAGAAPAPAPAPTISPIAQPTATPTTAVPTAAGAPQLTHASVAAAVERVQDLVRIATTRLGGARATLQLKPQELGAVDVHLRTTREGLVATISAHDQAGLAALQQAGPELRRSLEERGVQLHSLDLQLGAGDNGFTNQGDAREASSGGRSARAGWNLGGEDEPTEAELTLTTVASSPTGALVDVQA
jgi:flagellar hook-length control protein FliK